MHSGADAMIHVLIGAAIGALCGAGSSIAFSLITHRKVTWQSVAAATLGGAVGGAVTAATFGAGGVVAASMGRAATGLILGGAAGGATSRASENELEGKPLGQGVLKSAAISAAGSVVTGGVMKYGVGPALQRSFPAVASRLGLGVAEDPPPTIVETPATPPPGLPPPAAATPAAAPPQLPPPGDPQPGLIGAIGR